MKTIKILSFLLAILSVSCSISSVEDFVVGDNFITDNTGMMMIDSLTIKSSTIKFDSIVSSTPDRLLAGCNYNSFSGFKKSDSYLEMTFDDVISNTEFVFDSLCLILNYDTYYSGDTAVTQTISIHQLKEEMELGDDSYLYTTSKFTFDDEAIGSVNLKPKPNTKKDLSIRLSDKLGERLSQMIKDKKDTITSTSLFKPFFKGLVIESQSDLKGAIIGFSTTATATDTETTTKGYTVKNPEMRIYYHLSPNPNNLSDLYYKFSFNSDGIYFNQISENSTNSLIETISETDNEISSTQTNNNIIVQSGIQLFSKLSFPYVDNLLLTGKNSGFIGATLRLYPVKGTYEKSSNLPASLYVYSSDKRNNISAQVTLLGGTDAIYANLKIVSDVEETIYYDIDISSFIDTELKANLETHYSLLIGYGSSDNSEKNDHVILGGINSGKYSPELKIYYYHN